ncbi:MAG: hypothetical protein AUJ28_02915 [Parcubacteria group bacterium CG1_02_37_51]|uniref:Uncharacterized protein n=2 Tax=Candidatus Komeiliibacteriota TaxID=1817908 RepID=A0A2M8DRF4_9BACT|nr:MAG: hypothetical protein AUJ28_02915 [Parcubacteria group bacterium CG1_02_37_51]PIY95406.1 MAG: hypothetical protein COY67_00140 [Candidatus Komeilibacteria bacterium CG_4_10_14_0_8_um_filter_37_78]PJC01975.1 MAG: hypothetical protein CO073_01895 [Candidatus Komeilibacteria bacterium CG_4_9_14_0_8_um_filter_36_9]
MEIFGYSWIYLVNGVRYEVQTVFDKQHDARCELAYAVCGLQATCCLDGMLKKLATMQVKLLQGPNPLQAKPLGELCYSYVDEV